MIINLKKQLSQKLHILSTIEIDKRSCIIDKKERILHYTHEKEDHESCLPPIGQWL